MQTVADQIIDTLGGTTAVARMTDAPLSTVHSWRKNGIPRSRLAHLRLLASVERPDIDLDAITASVEKVRSSLTTCCLCQRTSDNTATLTCRHINCPIQEEREEQDLIARGVLTKAAA